MITKAPRGTQGILKFPQKLHHSQSYQLIKKGSQIACNRKLGYHGSCTLCKGSVQYPRVGISSLAKRQENLIFAILTLPLVYGPEITTCCYKGLLYEYIMLCYRFPIKGPA
jgi:hypothetical protein